MPELTIEVVDEDPVLLDPLRGAGFDVQAAGSVPGMRRAVADTAIVLPPGYSVRAVRPEETVARVEVHRAA